MMLCACHSHVPCRAALPVITTLLCTSKSYRFSDAIQKSGPGIDLKLVVLAVDPQNHGKRSRDVRRVLACHRGSALRTVTRVSGFVLNSHRCLYSPDQCIKAEFGEDFQSTGHGRALNFVQIARHPHDHPEEGKTARVRIRRSSLH